VIHLKNFKTSGSESAFGILFLSPWVCPQVEHVRGSWRQHTQRELLVEDANWIDDNLALQFDNVQ
jgi:hypothetical protein